MQKKHRYARAGLLISLLSFNIFSSCVHTRQTLGFDQAGPSRERSYNYHLIEEGQREDDPNDPEWKVVWLTLGVWMVVSWICYFYYDYVRWWSPMVSLSANATLTAS